MVDRNTIVGIDFLVAGSVLAGLGYAAAQSISIAAIGLDIGVIGALLILIVPEPIPQDAYKALLKDSTANIEMILEESSLKERAYFLPTDDGRVRAFIPISQVAGSHPQLVQGLAKAPERFISNFRGVQGLFLLPPGNEIVRLSKVKHGDDLEDALRFALVEFSDLASSVMLSEEDKSVKIHISKPKLASNSPFFNECLGSLVSCVSSCVVASVKRSPVRIMEEKTDKGIVRLTIEIV